MYTFAMPQPDVLKIDPSWDSIKGEDFWNEIAKETHQKHARDIMPRITGLGKLASAELGSMKTGAVPPGLLVGIGLVGAGVSGVVAWAIFESFHDEKSTTLKVGLWAGGLVSGLAFLCSIAAAIKGGAVLFGITPPDAAKVTVQNPATGEESSGVITKDQVQAAQAAQAAEPAAPAPAAEEAPGADHMTVPDHAGSEVADTSASA